MIADPILATRFWLHDEGSGSPLVYRFTDAQIQEFLDLEKTDDTNGLKPAQTGYIPTYDVLRAAGRGWMWLAGMVGNTASYSAGDVSVTYDRNYCLSQARLLMASASATATRKDEPAYERIREEYYDGEDPRDRS